MSLGKQVGIVSLILLAVVAAGYWYAGSSTGGGDADAAIRHQPQPARVEVTVVAPTTLARRVEAVGTTLARQSVDIRPAASGRVVTVDFVAGSLIEPGSLLARLDDEAEQADVAEAEADLRAAEIAFDRALRLASNQTIAQASVDEQEAAYDAAKARLQRAQKQLRERSIRAPFAGRIGLRQVSIGARVDEATVITTLDDLAEIDVDFSVPELFFGDVAAGQAITATSAAYGAREFRGKIATVDSRIDRVSRSFQVRARIPNPDLTLPTGMFVLVDLTLDEREVLTVPEESVMTVDDRASVFVIAGGKAERRTVTLGQREIGLVEVVDGLAAGEQVVVTGIQHAREGEPVLIIDDAGSEQKNQPAGEPDAATMTGPA